MSVLPTMELRGDVLLDSFAVTFNGQHFQVKRYGETTYVLDEDGRKPLGMIRAAGPSSGSIWTNGDCVGEYYLAEGRYYVVPIRDGFRQPEMKTESHPILFLLQSQLGRG